MRGGQRFGGSAASGQRIVARPTTCMIQMCGKLGGSAAGGGKRIRYLDSNARVLVGITILCNACLRLQSAVGFGSKIVHKNGLITPDITTLAHGGLRSSRCFMRITTQILFKRGSTV